MDCLDICVVAEPGASRIAVIARCGAHTVVDSLPASAITALGSFRGRLERAILGQEQRPSQAEIHAYGRSLFAALAQQRLQLLLHGGLPVGPLSFTLMSNRPDFQALPWEYISEPQRPFGPAIDRSVVRVVPTLGVAGHAPGPLSSPPRVLFVSADPLGQEPVSWADARDSIERAFTGEMPEEFALEVIEGATLKSLRTHVMNNPAYDIVHFSCHGRVSASGEGELLLVDARTKKESPITATQLCALLRGRGIRLVVLSACETATGNFASDFAVMADALVHCGIPAVVGNQFPVHNNSVAVFVGALYEQLLQSGDIDVAVAAGRVALHTALQSQDSVLEWGIPALYRHATAARLFTP